MFFVPTEVQSHSSILHLESVGFHIQDVEATTVYSHVNVRCQRRTKDTDLMGESVPTVVVAPTSRDGYTRREHRGISKSPF